MNSVHSKSVPARAQGRVVVITGGTAGVGRAVARRFASDGASIALLARGPEALEATAQELTARGARVLPLQVDVAAPEQVFDAAARIERELGPVDVWINNAMTTVFAPSWALSPAEYRRVTDVTYHGCVWGTQAALTSMRARNRGVIVQVGSALAYRSIPLQAAYCGAKHAVRAFTDALRCELRHEGIDVHLTMVQLPAVNTPQFRQCLNKMPNEPQPVPPIFQPEIAAEAIYYAASHRRREIYVGHPTVETVVGQKLAPGLLDRYLAHAGWEGQFTPDRADPQRPNNLFAPVSGQHATHGVFDAVARERDVLTHVLVRLGAAGVRVVVFLISWIWGPIVLARRAVATLKRSRAAEHGT